MDIKVSDCMTTDPVTCHPDDTDAHVAHLMWDRDCGVIPVIDDEQHVIGMVTDRDLCMSACLHGESLGSLRVSEAMCREVKTCRPEDALEDALEIMGNHQLHRLAVVGDDERLAGVLSLADCARYVPRLARTPERTRLASTLCDALAMISEPRQVWPGMRSADEPRETGSDDRRSMSA